MLEGRTFPNKMYSVPLGMAAMGALFINVGGQLVQLNRAGPPTTVDEFEPAAPVCRNSFHDGAVSQIFKKGHVLETSARESSQLRSSVARCLVKPRLHMLKGGLHEIELAPVPVNNDKFCIHAHAVDPQLVQKQANGSTGWASRALPWRIGLVVGRGGGGPERPTTWGPLGCHTNLGESSRHRCCQQGF